MKRGIAAALACMLASLPLAAGAVDRTLGAAAAKPALNGAPWTAHGVAQLARDLDALLDAAPTLRGAHTGLLVVDSRTGDVLYARNAAHAFAPASTMKLVTGSAALAKLGPTYRQRTTASIDTLRDGTIGGITVRGGGDALLDGHALDDLVATLRSRRIASIAGAVTVDASHFSEDPYPRGWSWDDFPYGYAPRISAASFEENVVHLHVAPGLHVGDAARVTVGPLPADMRIAVGARTGPAASDDTIDIARDDANTALVTGSIPSGAQPDDLDAAVPDPAGFLRTALTQRLAAAGISMANAPPSTSSTAVAVWSHDGEPLSDLLADMWWPSDNLIAESLLREIGVAASGEPGTVEHGAAFEADWLRGIGVDPATLTIADGSGLSTYDRLTPQALVAVLQADWSGPFRDIVLDDLPLSGARGTLRTQFTGTLADRRVFAKTGSMLHVRGLAGYLATLHHGAVTFAWSLDDWLGTDPDLHTLRARVLARIIGD